VSTNRLAARSKNTARRRAAAAAVSVGAGILGTHSAEAAIVTIDIGPSGFNIEGVNAGLASGGTRNVSNFPMSGGGSLNLINDPNDGYQGAGSSYFLTFAYSDGAVFNFSGGATIGSSFSGTWVSGGYPLFKYLGITSPNFGSDSYLGFRTAQGNYGWMEATWDGTDFQFYSAAYESTPGVAIAAGAVAVPEPSTTALLGLGALALGAGAVRKQRAARRPQAAAAVSA
jgi:hypothetical protein